MDDRMFGFVGLGNMGGPMAARFLEAGYRLTVYDLNPEVVADAVAKGAGAAGSLAELADIADVVFLSLPTPDVVRAVSLGADGLAGGTRTRIVVDLSTTGSQVSEEVAAGLAEAGKILLDCPVSGGPTGAARGTLALMLAGDPQAAEGVAPSLAPFGRVFRVGDVAGQGQTLKVLNNVMSAAALTICSEALVAGTKAGLDPDVMLEVINAGSGRNTASEDKAPRCILPRSFDFGFPVGLLHKDVRLCLEEADRLGVPMIVGTAVRQLLTIARDRQGWDTDITAVIRTVEEWAGVEVRGKAAPRP